MGDITQAIKAFNAEEGIEAQDSHVSETRALVKVMDEDAVGRFYKVARETGVELSAVTRDGLSTTVLDAWADE